MKRESGGGGDEAQERKMSRRDVGLSTDRSSYSKLPFPYFARPMEVGSFSTVGAKEFAAGRGQLRFLALPSPTARLAWDLDAGYDSWIQDETKVFLQPICDWLQYEAKRTEKGLRATLQGARFVCWRGVLTKIAATPYDCRTSWRIAVCRVGETIFLAEFDTPERLADEAAMTERNKRMSYWGHKFESYLTADKEGHVDSESPVNCLEQFLVVAKGRLGEHRLLLAGEVDCQDAERREYVELKTTREMSPGSRAEGSFHRFKTLKWWLQSFLLGVPRIIAGFRDDDGLVQRLQPFSLDELARDPRRGWEGAVGLNFAQAFLSLLAQSMTQDDPSQVWLAERRPNARELEPLRLLHGSERDQYAFLTDQFLQFAAQHP